MTQHAVIFSDETANRGGGDGCGGMVHLVGGYLYWGWYQIRHRRWNWCQGQIPQELVAELYGWRL